MSDHEVEDDENVSTTPRLDFSKSAAPVETEVEDQEEDEAEDVEADATPAETEDERLARLESERQTLDAEIKAIKDAEKQSVLEQIKAVVLAYSITTEEVVEHLGGLKSKRKGVKAIVRYRDPVSGATWSGRGKEPAWIKGHKREDFLLPEDQQVRPA